IQDAVFRSQERRELALQLPVDILRSADKAHTAHTVSTGVNRAVCRCDHVRMTGKSEVIVGAEVQDLPAAYHDFGALCAGNDPLGLEETGSPDLIQLAGYPGHKGFVHSILL